MAKSPVHREGGFFESLNAIPSPKPEKSVSPTDLAQRIQKNSEVVNELASALSQRINDFEGWLGDLPGKVVTTCWIPDPTDTRHEMYFGLRFARQGQWRLLIGEQYQHDEDDDAVDWNLLCDASLELKMRAVGMFPKLLESMAVAQEMRSKELREVNKSFEAFANLIGLKEAEGGSDDAPF